MKPPEIVTATQAELDELLTLARTSFPQKQYQLLEGVLGTFVHVMLGLQNAKTSIKRLRHMIFGAPTESKRNVLKALETSAPGGESPLPGVAAAVEGAATPVTDAQAPPAGHGRNGAQAYRRSEERRVGKEC